MDTEDFAPQNGTESACACPNRSKPTTTRLKHRIWIDRRTLYPRIRRHISQNNEDCNQSVDAGYCKYVLRGTAPLALRRQYAHGRVNSAAIFQSDWPQYLSYLGREIEHFTACIYCSGHHRRGGCCVANCVRSRTGGRISDLFFHASPGAGGTGPPWRRHSLPRCDWHCRLLSTIEYAEVSSAESCRWSREVALGGARARLGPGAYWVARAVLQ